MIGRPRNSVEFAKRGLHGRRVTPEEIAIEAERMGLAVAGPQERTTPRGESPRRQSLQDEADRILAEAR